MVDHDDLKKCPDCAEMVRAEAMKCRYCDYRFDVRRRAEKPAPSLFARLRRPREAESPFDLLSEWGVELALGETVRFWLFGHVSARSGYLIFTDDQVLFVGLVGRRDTSTLFHIRFQV